MLKMYDMSMTTSARWERLAADLSEIGVEVRVTERPYAESAYGRVQYGVSRGMTLRHPGGGLVGVRDKWWRKNPDVWIGWQVDVANREGIEVRHWPITKKRSEVVAAVRDALALSVSA